MLCELRGEELLVILSMVTPALVGLGLLCSYAHHLTLLLPGSLQPCKEAHQHWEQAFQLVHAGRI